MIWGSWLSKSHQFYGQNSWTASFSSGREDSGDFYNLDTFVKVLPNPLLNKERIGQIQNNYF